MSAAVSGSCSAVQPSAAQCGCGWLQVDSGEPDIRQGLLVFSSPPADTSRNQRQLRTRAHQHRQVDWLRCVAGARDDPRPRLQCDHRSFVGASLPPGGTRGCAYHSQLAATTFRNASCDCCPGTVPCLTLHTVPSSRVESSRAESSRVTRCLSLLRIAA